MAFPVVAATNESSTNTAGTSHTVNLPTGISAGDLLIVCLDKGSTAATVNALAGWTELLDENSNNGLYIAYRQADGTEGATITLTTSASTRSAEITFRITGAADPATQAPQIGTTAAATSATPDPPSVSPTGGAKDYLWIAFYGAQGEELDDDTWSDTPPTSYTPTPPLQKACGTAGPSLGGLIAAASRQNNTATENPGTFAKDVSIGWRAQTIAIHPSAAIVVSGGTASESDSATAGASSKAVAGGTASESDSAPAGASSKIAAGGTAAESDSAPAGASTKLVAGGTAAELDAALAGSILAPIVVIGGTAIETDIATAGAALKEILGGTASESNATFSATLIDKLVVGGSAIELDSATAGAGLKEVLGGTASESDAALAATLLDKLVAGGTAAELDAALAGTVIAPIVVLGGTAVELDAARSGTVLAGTMIVPLMQNGFMRHVGPPYDTDEFHHGPIIVVTPDNAEPPVAEVGGFLRDARGYLVIQPAEGAGVAEVSGFLRTVSP